MSRKTSSVPSELASGDAKYSPRALMVRRGIGGSAKYFPDFDSVDVLRKAEKRLATKTIWILLRFYSQPNDMMRAFSVGPCAGSDFFYVKTDFM